MDVMHERVAGLDVHKETVVACVRIAAAGKVSREGRTFETTTTGLEALLAWLTESECTHVAMEATGVYWKPVWNILSDGKFELMVANAAHIKNVPGRKTDMNDAMWIADLLACGLIRASFVPEQEIQELRSLLRTRKQLTREQTRHVQRTQKTLEEANIKLDSVISDIMGVTGRRMIEAMIEDQRNPFKLAELADRRIKASRKELYDALHGRLTDHHRFMLRLHLRQYDALAGAIDEIDQEIDAAIARMDAEVVAGQATFCSLIALLCTIPGVSELSALTILAEIGTDMGRFPTAGHLVSWAGLCPGQNESAGKRKSSRLRKGAP
jgi:transposase